MPAFVTNGPDIPERLLQAHEEGRVVFFCGAGISYPARLPGFDGLVDLLYKKSGVTRSGVQKAAIKAGQFDTAIGLLEADVVGGREIVREYVAKILTPDLSAANSTATHKALLTLARNRRGQLRLVTTNCDRLFEEVVSRGGAAVETFKAPLLPVPKNRWDGLVYLHGLLSPQPTASELDRLVLSSGDFGLAYLTERWAARFVSELFRNYTVCFVGYSINDPVLRYMMDALAADRLLGESPPEMFAFGSYSKGKEVESANEWRAKNVTPILYRMRSRHTYLHKTLRVWANTYRDGVQGKQMIITQHATTPPLASSRSDFAVGRVLWALTDGLAARHFADLDPVPPLEWLEPLAEEQFGHDDLSRFGVVPNTKVDEKLSFSMIQRPAPYMRAPEMSIVETGTGTSRWDEVMLQLARWLTRHLDDPKLVVWLTKRGGQLCEPFAGLVRRQIAELDRPVREDSRDELAPNAILRPVMRTLWRLILSGRVKAHEHGFGLYDWLDRVKQDGLTPTLRIELRELLTPCVTLREPFRWGQEETDRHESERVKDIVEWEIVLNSDDPHSILSVPASNTAWQGNLPDLLNDLSVLLRDALDLMRELGGAEDESDLSYIAQPSISKHPQNQTFHDWTALIELTRDAWMALAQRNPEQAMLVADGWRHVPYPLFKRLAFFAASRRHVIAPALAANWLLTDHSWWLWSVETQREALRLLVSLAPNLDAQTFAQVEQAILQGPPRKMFKQNIGPREWKRIVSREVWLRLAKMQAAGAVLGKDAKTKLDELTEYEPRWQVAGDEQDEFPVWTSDGDGRRKYAVTPRGRRKLVVWLKEHPSPDDWQEDDWGLRCSNDFPTTACALMALAREGVWLDERWREALQAWADGKLLRRSWRYMARVINSAPDDVLLRLSNSLPTWLQVQAKTFEGQEKLFLALVRRLFDLDHKDAKRDDDDSVFLAINHPIGRLTEALLHWWYRQEPIGTQGLKDNVKLLFTEVCEARIEKFRHGRVLLAANVISLFRADEKWTTTHLLPLFDWQRSESEACAAWQGFLRSPRSYRPLLSAIKGSLLETATHYMQLGRYAEQYATFLTFAALDRGDTFTAKELAKATATLPEEGLRSTAKALVRALEGADDQHAEYWRNRVLPYLKSIWPKSRNVLTPAISKSFGQLCVAARDAFPEAMEVLWHWLQPVEFLGRLVHQLLEANICKLCPSEALKFLDIIIGDGSQLLPRELRKCLNDIEDADQALADTSPFVRLSTLCQRLGI